MSDDVSEDEFPFRCLPPIMQDAVSDISSRARAPIPQIVAAVLASVSQAFQGAIDVQRPGMDPSATGLILIVLAISGERKSSVWRMAFSAQSEFESFLKETNAHGIADREAKLLRWTIERDEILVALRKATRKKLSMDGLEADLAKHLSEKPKCLPEPQIILTDATPEAISAASRSEWPWIALIAGEGDELLNGRALQRMSVVTKGWDGDRGPVHRVGATAKSVADPRMTLFAMIQADLFAKFMNRKGREAHSLGLFARTLICEPFSMIGRRMTSIGGYPPSMEGLKTLNARILGVLKTTWAKVQVEDFGRVRLGFSEDAARYWVSYCNWVESECRSSGRFFEMPEYASKMAEQLARLAALFAYAGGDVSEISLEDVTCAQEVLAYFTNEHMRLFLPPRQISPTETDAETLRRWLVSKIAEGKGNVVFGKRWIQQFSKVRDAKARNAALQWLAREGKVVEFTESGTAYIECLPSIHHYPYKKSSTRYMSQFSPFNA